MMTDYIITRTSPDELMHFGIKGQKWGVRRWQNDDGTLTPDGKAKYEQSMKDASKYQTAKERLKKVAKGGAVGLAVGAGVIGGVALAENSAYNMGGVHKALLNAVTTSHGRDFAAKTLAATAIGGLVISGINQGYQAAKVKMGQNFISKYAAAYAKTNK